MLHKNQVGFTLVELLVVIAIIGLLAVVAYVNIASAKEKARINSALYFEASVHNALGSQLEAAWTFDAASLADTSGKGHDGIATGPITYRNQTNGCIRNGCIEVGGDFDALRTTNAGSWLTPQRMTISMWVKIAGDTGDSQQSFGSAQGLRNWTLQFGHWMDDGSGTYTFRPGIPLFFTAYNNAFNRNEITGLQPINDNKWHHIAASYSAQGTNLALYVDGKLQSRMLGGANIVTAPDDFWAAETNGGIHLLGFVDDVRIYSESLME